MGLLFVAICMWHNLFACQEYTNIIFDQKVYKGCPWRQRTRKEQISPTHNNITPQKKKERKKKKKKKKKKTLAFIETFRVTAQ